MIQLKTKKKIHGLGAFNDVSAVVYCQLQTFTEDLTAGNYVANGRYYYQITQGEQTTDHVLKSFVKEFTASQADELFKALNISYPTNATFSQQRNIEKNAALLYVVASEQRFGLTQKDWI